MIFLGCMDDRGTQYSFGQQFVTTDCCQCFCGNGGSISCDQTQNTSSKLTIKSVIMRKSVFLIIMKNKYVARIRPTM